MASMRWWKEAPEKATLLAVGAHPDDVEIHAGGAVAKHALQGDTVVVLDATEGEMSTNGDVPIRQRETEKASEILGICARVNLGLPDGRLSRCSELPDLLVEVIRRVRPDILIGPPPKCRHPDHRAVHLALEEASYTCGLRKYIPDIPVCERPLKLFGYLEVHDLAPTHLIDISGEAFRRKRDSVLAHASQFVQGSGARPTMINSGFVEKIESRNRHYGRMAGVEYAEPYLGETPVLIRDFNG